MAYKALYRTYRPNRFEEVAGQQHVVQTLRHAVEKNKIAHAYLFCGPRGTGKTSIAKIFAKTINCEHPDRKPCGECENCKAVEQGNHPDIIEIDAASNNGVEEVRSLIEKVKYAPLKGKYKVYIIDEVHMMSTGAFNALLKTIEEPPEHVIFILATTEPHKVLPTIISRCQRFDFTKVPRNDIIQRLLTVLETEHIHCEDEVIRLIAQLADGGLRDALSILDQCIAYAQNDIKIHHINEIYGITTMQEKMELFQDIHEKRAVSLLGKIDQLLEKGIDIKRLTSDLIEMLKESIIFEYTKDAGLLHQLNSDEAMQFVENKSITDRFEMIHLLMETYDKYKSAANVGSYFEVCMLQMLNIEEHHSNKQQTSELHIAHDKEKQNLKSKLHEKNVSRETINKKPELNVPEEDEPYESYIEEKVEGNADIGQFILPGLADDETSEKVEKQHISSKTLRPLDDEFILSLLAGANKPEKANDMKNFQAITELMMDFKWAKCGSLLKHSSIVGSGVNYVVVSVDNQAVANEINEMDSNNEFHDFILELLKKNKKVFAISIEQQKMIIQEFKNRMIAGTLPEPVQIDTVTIEKEEKKEKSQEEIVLDLFGPDNITITEE